METRLQLSQLGSPLCILPQMGTNFSLMDSNCWKCSTFAGDFFGSFASNTTPSWRVYTSSSTITTAIGSQRMQMGHAKAFPISDGDTRLPRLMRHRMRRGRDMGDCVTSPAFERIKVRSLVDEATAHSSDIELNRPSASNKREVEDEAALTKDQESEAEERAIVSGVEVACVKKSASETENKDPRESHGDGDDEDFAGIQIIESPPPIETGYEDLKAREDKNWNVEDMKRVNLLRNFEYRHNGDRGVIVVQALRVEHMKDVEELLVDSFAELMGGILTYRPLLSLTVRQYVRDRYGYLPDAVTLMALYAPEEDNVLMNMTDNIWSGNWILAGTVELSFSDIGHPDIPAGPSPPPGSPYLCNMAVSEAYRRRGIGRQLLKAAEKLAIASGCEDMYLHCRMVDLAPLNMYQSAGYQIVATDSILSLLSFQRRRYLMRKKLPSANAS